MSAVHHPDLERLRALLASYAGDSAELAEIDALLTEAVDRGRVRVGMTVDEVGAVLGPPLLEIGTPKEEGYGWGYPCRPRPEPGVRAGAPCYLWFDVSDGRIASIRRRSWIGGR